MKKDPFEPGVPSPIFIGFGPILLATVTMLNCGVTWSFLVVIKALGALLYIMNDFADVKETNDSPLQEGKLFRQNLIR